MDTPGRSWRSGPARTLRLGRTDLCERSLTRSLRVTLEQLVEQICRARRLSIEPLRSPSCTFESATSRSGPRRSRFAVNRTASRHTQPGGQISEPRFTCSRPPARASEQNRNPSKARMGCPAPKFSRLALSWRSRQHQSRKNPRPSSRDNAARSLDLDSESHIELGCACISGADRARMNDVLAYCQSFNERELTFCDHDVDPFGNIELARRIKQIVLRTMAIRSR
jgi:hypothetical protein